MTASSWKTGQSDLWTDPAAWSTGTIPGSADDVTVGVAPVFAGAPYTVTLQTSQSAHSITQSQAASTIAVSGCTLSVAGTYALGGTVSLAQAVLAGGTVASTLGTVLLSGNTGISGVSWQGTLDLVRAAGSVFDPTVVLTNDSFTGAGGAGAGAGSIVLGTGVEAQIDPSTVLADVSVVLNSASLSQSSGTLAFGSLSTVSASGSCSIGYAGAALTNDGLISAAGTGTSVAVAASSFSGQGTVSVSNGASLFLVGNVSDAGLLSVGAGSYLDVQSADGNGLFHGTQFQVQGGTLSLDASLATAQLAPLHIANGTLALAGTLQNAGYTLHPSAGANLANLDLAGGTIIGGTIVNQGAFTVDANAPQNAYSQTGTSQMTRVTFEGTLDVGASAQLDLNGFTLTGMGGSGEGSIVIATTGLVDVLDNETLNASISIGTDDLSSYVANGLYAAGTLTLGAQTVTTVAETNATIAGSGQSGLVINVGTIDLTSEAASLSLYNVVNNGQITVAAGEVSAQNMTNDGTITVTSGALGETGPFLNAGLISISGTGSSDNSTGYTSGLANAGTFSVSNGATAYLGTYGTGWTNSGTILVVNANLFLAGIFTTGQLGDLQAGQAGTLSLLGTLENTGTFSVGQGTSVSALALDGGIKGGTVIDTGGGLIGAGGVLSDVAFDGTLALTQDQSDLTIDSFTRFSQASGGAGSILITGSASSLAADGNTTLNDVAISLGSSGGTAATLGATYGETLTLGASTIVTQTGALAGLGVPFGSMGTVLNQGVVIADQAGGTLSLTGLITNAGTVAVGNGDTLLLSANALVNTGVISVTNAAVDLQYASLAQLSELTLVDSAVAVTGQLNALGGTLSVGAGGLVPLLQVEGTISGGTIHDAGGGVQFAGNGLLNGVTYQGVMTVNRPLSAVIVTGGLTLQGMQGSGAGSLALTGAGSTLVWDSTQALDNATLSIGGDATSYGGHAIAAPSLVADQSPVQTVTEVLLGSHLHVVQSGLYADFGSAYGTFSSAATMTANLAHGQLVLQGQSFTNTGTIGVSATDTVLVGSEGFTNAGLIVVGVGSEVELDLYNYFAEGSLAAQSFTNTGTVMMAGGMLAEQTGNGAFPKVPLLNAQGGHIVGAGVVASQVDNDGIIEARQGVLDMLQVISGTGALQVDGGAMLVLGGVGAGQTVSFAGAGGVLGLLPPYFLGTIGGFASGDTIDVLDTSAGSAAFSGDSIVVSLSTGGTLRLATTSALSGSLTVTAGTHGDELIRFAAGAGSPAPHALVSTGADVFARQAEPLAPIGYGLGAVHFGHVV